MAGRREHPRYPIRLAVRYPSARSLLGDYTRSISKGGVAIESERDLEIDTEFVFVMSSPELPEPVEVQGRVVWTRPAGPGKFTLGIQYSFDDEPRRERLELVLETVLAEHGFERQRRHPRVPVSIEVREGARLWIMRDLSLGGAMLQAVGQEAVAIDPGRRLRLFVRVEEFDAGLAGEVVWVGQPFPLHDDVVPGRIGLKFAILAPEVARIVDQIMRTLLRPDRVSLELLREPKRGLD